MKEGWEVKKLGEIATYINGYAFKPTQWGDSGVPIIRIQNLNSNDALYNYYDGEISNKYVVEYGDILISWSASLGVYEWKGQRSYLNQHIFKVVFDKIDINKYFLKYAVSGKLAEMLKDAHGATMKHVVKKDFDNTKIAIPPLPEQSRIVEELDLLSNIIEKKRQQLSELDNLAQSIFYDMFGDPVKNEKGWEVKKLTDVCHIQYGYAFDSSCFCDDESYPQLVRIRDIIRGFSETFYKGDIPEGYYVYKGDYLIGMDGEFNIAPWQTEKALLNQRVCKISSIGNIVDCFVYYYMRNILKEIEKETSFVTVKHLSAKRLNSIFIPLPPLSLQQLFAQKIEAIEKEKELIKQSIKATEELFNSRMDYYFS